MKRLLPTTILLTLVACGGGGPSSPTQPSTPAARAVVTVAAFTVTPALSGTEYRYSFPISLQNTGAVTATINVVEFKVTAPGMPVGTGTATPAELFGTSTLASGATTSRITVTLTDSTEHPFASSIAVVVTYSDTVGSNTAMQSAAVPALPAPPPTVTFTLSGTVVDGSVGVSGARVEVTTGQDAGAAVLTDASGVFSFPSLQPGTFTLIVSKSGYSNLQQNVVLTGNTTGLRLSLTKTSTPPPAPPSLCAPATASCGSATARCNDGTLSCSQSRSGTCSSHNGVSCFICPGLLCSAIEASAGVTWTPVAAPFTPIGGGIRRE